MPLTIPRSAESASRIRERLQDNPSVLLYFSSGRYSPSWEDYPYDLVITVDRIHRPTGMGAKVVCLPMENGAAARLMSNLGLKAEALLAVNDGCREGGNYECLYVPSGFGRLIPLLKEDCLVLSDHLFPGHLAPYDAPPCAMPEWARTIQGTYGAMCSYRLVWNPLPDLVLQASPAMIKVTHDSAWNHLKALDAFLLPEALWRSRGLEAYLGFGSVLQATEDGSEARQGNPACYGFGPCANSILGPLRRAIEDGHRRIGVLPGFGRYAQTVLKEATQADLGDLQQLTFFHLDRKDFARGRAQAAFEATPDPLG